MNSTAYPLVPDITVRGSQFHPIPSGRIHWSEVDSDRGARSERTCSRAFVFRLGIRERNHPLSQFLSISRNIYNSSPFILSSYILIYWWFYSHLKCSISNFDLWSSSDFYVLVFVAETEWLELMFQFLIILEVFWQKQFSLIVTQFC